MRYLHDWIHWQETIGRKLNRRVEEILTQQGKADNYEREDVYAAVAQAKRELGIS